MDLARRAGVNNDRIQQFTGRLIDHLPMTDKDWEALAWAMKQIHNGTWREPWVVAFEYGGIGPLYKAVTDRETLAEQIPRLYDLVKGKTNNPAVT